MTLKQFQDKYNSWAMDRSNLPEHAFPKQKFRDDKEVHLKKAIRKHCQMNGWLFSAYDAKGFFMVKEKKFIPSKNDKGRGDGMIEIPIEINGMKLSKTVWIDIKIGRDFQKRHQREFELKALAANAAYIMPKSWDDYYRQINGVLSKLKTS